MLTSIWGRLFRWARGHRARPTTTFWGRLGQLRGQGLGVEGCRVQGLFGLLLRGFEGSEMHGFESRGFAFAD